MLTEQAMTNRPATAPPPAASSSGTFVAGWRATRDHRHGRHTCAAAAPRSKPAQRVKVARYMKLMRSAPSNAPMPEWIGPGPLACSQNMAIIAASDAAASTTATARRRSGSVLSTTNNSGHSRYHCSSTPRLHR